MLREWMRVKFFWVRVKCGNHLGNWVSLRGKTKWLNPRWPVSESNHGRIQDGCHHQVESEWMSEVFLWKMAESKMAAIIKLSQNEDFESDWISWSQSFEENGWIQDGRIQDGSCHHQVKWEWMSLSQIELVWVRVRVERECFWVNLREDNKVSESKMAESQSDMAEFKMAASSSWVRMNEWSFFVQIVGTNLGKCKES